MMLVVGNRMINFANVTHVEFNNVGLTAVLTIEFVHVGDCNKDDVRLIGKEAAATWNAVRGYASIVEAI